MYLLKYSCIAFYLVIQFSCTSQTSLDNIIITPPSIEQEASSIWRTINDIEFFEKQGYQIHLPEDARIQSLISQSKNKNFDDTDFENIYNLLESGVYKKDQYEAALQKTEDQLVLLNTLINQLRILNQTYNWDFKMFDSYNIIFTLYGTGGSYDPDNGTVTLFTTNDGKFMNYKNPANTIMHEIVHMGIEESIVQKYNLPHGLKERIVDLITFILFNKQLPQYKIQNMGDSKFDAYLKSKQDLKNLDTIVEKYLSEKN